MLQRVGRGREQGDELVILVDCAEFIGDKQAEGAFGKRRMGDAAGFFGDRRLVLRMQ